MIFATLALALLAAPPHRHSHSHSPHKAKVAANALEVKKNELKTDLHVTVSEDVAPSSKIQLSVNTTNVRNVHVVASRINGERWFSTMDKAERPRPTPIRKVTAWDISVADPKQQPNPNQADTFYERQVNLPKLPPGVYLLDVTSGVLDKWVVVNVTNLAIAIKRSVKHSLVWVTDFKTAHLVEGASVHYLDHEGKLVQASMTGKDGTSFKPLGPGNGIYVIQKGDDMAGIPSNQSDPDGTLVAHFQTDRPIYRTGQTISYRGILRRTLGSRYRAVVDSACTVTLRDPKDNAILRQNETTDAMGTVHGEFTVPQEEMTGPFTLVLQNGKDTIYQTVSIAQYRKPEFKVEAKPVENRYLAGEEISYEVDSAYYFGAPVPQAAVHYRVSRSPLKFQEYDAVTEMFYSGDGNLYPGDTYRANPLVADDTAYTDDNGKVLIKVPADPKLGDSTYSFDCTVTDASHRQVDASASVPVYGAMVRIGLACPFSYATLGTLVPITVRLVDWDGNSVGGQVNLALSHEVYDEKKNEWHEAEITTTSVQVPPSGKYTIKLPTQFEGDLFIHATTKDSTGRSTGRTYTLYVAGNYEKPQAEVKEPKVEIKLDRKEYEPGDQVGAFVSTNCPKLPVLEVLEGSDIFRYQVIPSAKSGQIWKFPVSQENSPNGYVTATEWVKGDVVASNAILPVPDRSTKLVVTVVPDRQTYKPGDHAKFSVHAENALGQPVSAEVAIGVVDEAIYAMAADNSGNIYGLYWGQRANGVSFVSSAPQELSGGAYQRVNALAPVRQRFEDTAYWSPDLKTDAQGNGSVEFEMPGNLTTWRATARAVTLETSVGSGIAKVVSTRPITLRLATPRQMVQGDQVDVMGTVDSRNPTASDYDIRLDTAGVDILGDHSKSIHINGKGEGKVVWTVKAGSIPANGLASFSGQVEAHGTNDPNFADALRTSMPVVPNGLPHRRIDAGSFTGSASFDFDVPAGRVEPASKIKLTLRCGITPVLTGSASSILDAPRFGTSGAANQIEVASLKLGPNWAKDLLESQALLARIQTPTGWGWWERAPSDPLLTARVLSALAFADFQHVDTMQSIKRSALETCIAQFAQTNLWEYRAVLASAVAQVKIEGLADRRAEALLDEVAEQNAPPKTNLSPYAWLKLADGYIALGKPEKAGPIVDRVLADVDQGPAESYLPAGEGTGWQGSDVQNTAELLYTLTLLKRDKEMGRKLAQWLTSEDQEWRSDEENATVVRALFGYLKENPESQQLGPITVTVNGTKVEAVPSTVDQSAVAAIPSSLLKDGKNSVQLSKSGSGQASYLLDTTVFLPNSQESTVGIRVLRRYEVKSAAGVWVELNRPVKIGEPVRCTLVAWGDNFRDAVQLTEPIPSGFEYVEDESGESAYQEVRDAAVLHYLVNGSNPQVFSYYLRSESAGTLTALPVSAAYVRRPSLHGNSAPISLKVEEQAPAK